MGSCKLTEKIAIYKDDASEMLKTFDDETFDAVITDPPYGTNDGRGKSIRRGTEDVNFGTLDWDKKLPLAYIGQLKRVMKPDTWGFIFTDNMAVSYIWDELEEQGLSPRNTFYWIKYNKAPTPRSNFMSCVETAVAFTKGRTTVKWNGGATQPNYVVLPISTRDRLHPTQKPVSLMEILIDLVTDEGDVVLDPFMGSGTTGVGCINLKRGFVGVDISGEYFDITKQRLREKLKQPHLF